MGGLKGAARCKGIEAVTNTIVANVAIIRFRSREGRNVFFIGRQSVDRCLMDGAYWIVLALLSLGISFLNPRDPAPGK